MVVPGSEYLLRFPTHLLICSASQKQSVMADEGADAMPWRDGHWKALDGGHDVRIIKGGKVIEKKSNKVFATLQHGIFGEADPKIVEMTGESRYNVELRHVGKHEDLVDLGVVLDGGRKIVFKTQSGLIRPFEWVTEEEAEQFSKEGQDPIGAPPSHYKPQPEYQGRLICITGPPGG